MAWEYKTKGQFRPRLSNTGTPRTDWDVTVQIDWPRLVADLGAKAAKNKNGKSKLACGVVVTVKPAKAVK